MLWSLYILTTALTCVSAVTVVTQSPPVVTVRRGQTASLNCNLGTVTDVAAAWHKQIPEKAPESILEYHRTSKSPTYYNPRFSAPKFTSTSQSTSDYRLVINNVDEGDSAVYYCRTLDKSAKEQVFGPGTKLIVSDLRLPVLSVFPPSHSQLQSHTASLLCVSNQAGPFGQVTWLSNGSPVTGGVLTGSSVQLSDRSFQMSSSLTIRTSDWSSDKVFTCRVSVGNQSTEKNINKSQCGEDEEE